MDMYRHQFQRPRILAACMILIGLALSGCEVLPPPIVVDTVTSNDEPPPPPVCSVDVSGTPGENTSRAISSLENGKWDDAKCYVDAVLVQRPNSKKANLLLGQLTTEPEEYLDADSFVYIVKENETLSSIAGDQLGNVLLFPILALYNGIDYPKSIVTGSKIRLPGTGPALPSSQSVIDDTPAVVIPTVGVNTPVGVDEKNGVDAISAQARDAHEAGDIERAYKLILEASKIEPGNIAVKTAFSTYRAGLIKIITDKAYELERTGDDNAALERWYRITELDENNIDALHGIPRVTGRLRGPDQ